jgi:hypothetical protein
MESEKYVNTYALAKNRLTTENTPEVTAPVNTAITSPALIQSEKRSVAGERKSLTKLVAGSPFGTISTDKTSIFITDPKRRQGIAQIGHETLCPSPIARFAGSECGRKEYAGVACPISRTITPRRNKMTIIIALAIIALTFLVAAFMGVGRGHDRD